MQNTPFSLQNKTILITGAGAGLGEHFAKTLASHGAHVILSGRREERLSKVCGEIQKNGGTASSFPFDVSDFEHLEENVTHLFNQFGKIDVLVNNAGVSTQIKKEAWEYSYEDWDGVMNTNLKAVWFLSNLVAKKMMEKGTKGNIVNIASTVVNRTRLKNPIYGISKTAVASLTTKLACEYASHNIRINAIAPGFFETDINRNYVQSEQGQAFIQRGIPLARTGNLSELEGPLLLLTSDASSYMTGECIFVDGGLVGNALV